MAVLLCRADDNAEAIRKRLRTFKEDPTPTLQIRMDVKVKALQSCVAAPAHVKAKPP